MNDIVPETRNSYGFKYLHEKIGKIQPKLLTTIQLKNRIIDERNWERNCKWALNQMKKDTSVALVVRRDTLE